MIATRGALVAQRFESAHAAFVTSPASFDAFTNPDFFLRPELVELAIHHFFGGELLALARLVGREVAGIGAQQAAIELDDASDDPIQERAVVSDDDGRRSLDQEFFERRDAVDIQMVGRLVEHQQIGFQRQRQSERGAFAFAARGRFGCALGRNAETL